VNRNILCCGNANWFDIYWEMSRYINKRHRSGLIFALTSKLSTGEFIIYRW